MVCIPISWTVFHNLLWSTQRLGGSSSIAISFCFFTLFMGFLGQAHWGGLWFPPPVDHALSELFPMTHPSSVAVHSMVRSFIKLHKSLHHDKAVIHELGISSVEFSCSVVSDSLRPHGLQHTRLSCPSAIPWACSNSFPLSRWRYPIISPSVTSVSFCLQSFPASGSFPVNQFFASGGQRIGVSASASVLPMNIQDWFPLGWTGWISLLSKELWRIFSNTTVQKHQFFGTQLSLWSNSYIHTWLLEKTIACTRQTLPEK